MTTCEVFTTIESIVFFALMTQYICCNHKLHKLTAFNSKNYHKRKNLKFWNGRISLTRKIKKKSNNNNSKEKR